jgi:hypothetical protein
MGRGKGRTRWPPSFPPAPAGSDPRTLQEIEGDDWGFPTVGTDLVRTCHALRLKPLGTFTVGDLQTLIGQSISTPILVPLALARLEEDPLIEGDFYPGDLLASLVNLDETYEAFWRLHPQEHRRAREVAERALEVLRERGRADLVDTKLIEWLIESIRTFLAK